MVDWKALFRPISEGQKRLAILVKRPAAPEPSLEEFISPLQEAVRTEIAIKQDIGYDSRCTCCSRQRTVDERLIEACETANDPVPWLQEMHGELISTREDLGKTRLQLAESERYHTPQNRMKWAVYGAAASGTASVAILAIKYATEWALHNLPAIIPFLLPLIP